MWVGTGPMASQHVSSFSQESDNVISSMLLTRDAFRGLGPQNRDCGERNAGNTKQE
jgi:hypothetical protein